MFHKLKFETFLGILMLAVVGILATKGIERAVATDAAVGKKVIVVDAGHGGRDPGKLGVNDALEKDINLAIAKKIQKILTEKGLQVVMTREDDAGLYDEQASNKKRDDMNKRLEKIDAAQPVLAVSIHQNSYSSASVHGSQVFFYSNSRQSSEIAECIQNALNEELQVDRPKTKKPNDSYFLLKKTKSPTVIVECGFLSNPEECAKLVTEEYQERVAVAISAGVVKYLESKN